MKKIMIGSALMLLSVSSYASTARLLALGMNETDNDGMYYIQDGRNVFLNPAYINNFNNRLVLEYGNVGKYATSSTGATIDLYSSAATLTSSTQPKAQGGFFKKAGNLNYGVYLGNESNTSTLLRVAGSSAVSTMNLYAGSSTTISSKMLQSADNQVDFFVGGDNGYKWGANLLFANGKDESRNGKNTSLAVRYGMIGSNWDAHLNLSLMSKSNATDNVSVAALGVAATDVTAEFKGKLGVQVGGSYDLNGAGKVYGWVKRYGWEQSDNYAYGAQSGNTVANAIGGQTGTTTGDFTAYYLGYAKEVTTSATDKVWIAINAKKTDINVDFYNKTTVRHLVVPVTVSFEAKATEWLTWRGSVIQNLYGKYDNQNVNNGGATGTRLNKVAQGLLAAIYGASGKSTIANSTAVNAGASLEFGNLSIDGLIGATSGDRTGTLGSGTNAGVLTFDNLMSSIGMNYKF